MRELENLLHELMAGKKVEILTQENISYHLSGKIQSIITFTNAIEVIVIAVDVTIQTDDINLV